LLTLRSKALPDRVWWCVLLGTAS